MASYLIPRTAARGLGPEAARVDEFFDAHGRLKSYAVLSDEMGDMQAALTLLELEMGKILRRPHARGYPPRIFVSYRRETPDDIAWCVRLAQALEANGYDVLLDELRLGRPLAGGGEILDLARFVALLTDADIALVVASAGYVGDSDSMRAWIFEEWSRIGYLGDFGLLETVIVHRSGDVSDGTMLGKIGARSAYLDLREAPEDHTPVLGFFGRYTGKCLDAANRARLGECAAKAVEASLRRPPNVDIARRALACIADLAGTEEHGVAEAHVRAAAGDREGCRDVALATLNQNPTLPTGFALARLLWLQDFDREAFAACAQLSEGPSLWRHCMKAIMADVLIREDLLVAAMNQYRWCLAANGSVLLGGYWSRLDAAAVENWQTTLDALAAQVGEFPGLQCEHCQAQFPEGWHACVHCGTTYPAGTECRLCDGDPPHAAAIPELGFCPVCRRFRTEDGGWGNAHLVPREPKGAWSPLAWRGA